MRRRTETGSKGMKGGGEEGKRIDFKSLYCPHELDQVTKVGRVECVQVHPLLGKIGNFS